jgi:hypothetical protein
MAGFWLQHGGGKKQKPSRAAVGLGWCLRRTIKIIVYEWGRAVENNRHHSRREIEVFSLDGATWSTDLPQIERIAKAREERLDKTLDEAKKFVRGRPGLAQKTRLWPSAADVLGSDTPFNPMEWEIEKIVKHAQRHLKLKIEDLRLIMSGNIKRLLKIN